MVAGSPHRRPHRPTWRNAFWSSVLTVRRAADDSASASRCCWSRVARGAAGSCTSVCGRDSSCASPSRGTCSASQSPTTWSSSPAASASPRSCPWSPPPTPPAPTGDCTTPGGNLRRWRSAPTSSATATASACTSAQRASGWRSRYRRGRDRCRDLCVRSDPAARRTRAEVAGRDCTLHVERFTNANVVASEADHPFDVELSLSGTTLTILPGESILDRVAQAGVAAPSRAGAARAERARRSCSRGSRITATRSSTHVSARSPKS